MRRFLHLRYWLPAGLCYGVILYFSLMHVPESLAAPVAGFDKGLHFLEFLVLGVLLGSAVLREHHYQRIPPKIKALVIGLVLVLAGLGELLQPLTGFRSADWLDYAANVTGTGTGLASYFFENGLLLSRRGVKSSYARFARYHLLKRIYFWLPPLILIGIISYYSHLTQSVVVANYRPMIMNMRPEGTSSPFFLNLWHIHLAQFGPLGFFLARAVAWETIWSKSRRRKIVVFGGIAILLLFSYFDEWHQGRISGRVNQFSDVIFNMMGGAVGMLVYWKGYRYIKEKYFVQ